MTSPAHGAAMLWPSNRNATAKTAAAEMKAAARNLADCGTSAGRATHAAGKASRTRVRPRTTEVLASDTGRHMACNASSRLVSEMAYGWRSNHAAVATAPARVTTVRTQHAAANGRSVRRVQPA